MTARRRIRRWLFAALLLGAALPGHAAAQACSGQWFSSASVNPAVIAFSTPTFVHFDNGAIVYQTTVSVNVNVIFNFLPWRLCMQTLSPDLGTHDAVTKPVADLEWQTSGGAWTPASFTPLTVATGRGDDVVQFNLRIRLSWDADPPGDYGTNLRFTISS